MINIPDYYTKVDSMPEDPENSIPYCTRSSQAEVFAMVYPIELEQAMPFDDVQKLIDGIHAQLGDNQGLIEVGRNSTKDGQAYIYSIVKTLLEPHGVQYTLSYQMIKDGGIIQLQGFFSEAGTTGQRDALVYAALSSEGKIGDDLSGWTEDPYDPNYKHGALMNLSEAEHVDEMFPEHPLTMARELKNFINENN
ncbi:MAG TPA: hypothetical protein GXZ74_07050 [Tissierellia bacterium]|nr:hypothetical protein [Tissierellia bacterium]